MATFDNRQRSVPAKAFTLVELLVVIGIIAILISILLPGLSKARKQANSVKCLSNLKQVSMATSLYCRENKDVVPTLRQDYPNNFLIGDTGAVGDSPRATDVTTRYWSDFVAPYVTKAKLNSNTGNNLNDARRSVLWGCPEWDPEGKVTATNTPFSTGYSINMNPLNFRADSKDERNAGFPSTANGGRFPYYNARWAVPSPVYMGTYYKLNQIRETGERLLIVDARMWLNHFRMSPTDPKLPPQWTDITATSSSVGGVGSNDIDRYRHGRNPGKVGTWQGRASFDASERGTEAFNTVFFDGHAGTMKSVDEAYVAIFRRRPGISVP